MSKEGFPEWPLYLSFLFGSLYIFIGLIDIFSALGYYTLPYTSGDIIASLMMVIVGTVYISGTPSLHNGEREGYAYTLVATTLASILFLLQVLVLGSNALGWLLQFEDWMQWNAFTDLTPPIWVFSLILITMGILRISGQLGGERGIFPTGGS